jgi:serine/threonine protein kinase
LIDDGDGPTGHLAGDEFDGSILDASQESGSLGRLGDYEILGVLGSGGFGIVLKAKDTTLRRLVAIKILGRGLAGSATARRRFFREARAAAGINHPNVVTIHAVEEHNGIPFLVMELIAGKTLRERIRQTPKLDFLEVLRIGIQIAHGLAAAHAHGIIHRDVKPGNIMLEDGMLRVKITDFGLARVTLDTTEHTSGQLSAGTPAYMAPEQVRGDEVDARADLFGLGCVLYAMFAGHSPFHGRTVLESAQLVVNSHPPNLADQSPAVPRFVGEIIDRLLQKDPAKRYQSAAEVADVLRSHMTLLNAAATDEIPELLRTGIRQRSPRKLRSALFIAAAVLSSVAALVWITRRDSPRRTDEQGDRPGAAITVEDTQPGRLPASAPAGEKSPLVTVARNGSAGFRSINEALRHVAPGGRVVVLDDAEYDEAVVVRDATAHAGIQLIAEGRAVLRSSAPVSVIRLHAVPGVHISGFKIIAAQAQHAIELTGQLDETVINDIEIERPGGSDPAGANVAAVYLHQGAAGSADHPIRLEGLAIYETVVGIVIGDHESAGRDPVPGHIVLENNRVIGVGEDGATLLVLLHGSQNVVIRNNILAQGVCGLSVKTAEGRIPEGWEFTHNTGYRLSSFAVWAGPVERSPTYTMSDNLLIEVRHISDEFVDAASRVGGSHRFGQNLWVAPPTDNIDRLRPLASFVESLPLLSTDARHPDFLKPDAAKLAPSQKQDPIPGRYELRP